MNIIIHTIDKKEEEIKKLLNKNNVLISINIFLNNYEKEFTNQLYNLYKIEKKIMKILMK